MADQYFDDSFDLYDGPREGQEFATQGQGGGIAVFLNGQYVWKEVPHWFTEADGKVGDIIPAEWDLIPITR